jgi:hypothetical protein
MVKFNRTKRNIKQCKVKREQNATLNDDKIKKNALYVTNINKQHK